MANTQNLKPWQPGQSGNPGGRPRRDAITCALRQKLEARAEDGEGSIAEAIATALVNLALCGDVRAIREIADRTEGRPRQQLEIGANAAVSGGTPDLSRLTDEELSQLEQLMEKIQ